MSRRLAATLKEQTEFAVKLTWSCRGVWETLGVRPLAEWYLRDAADGGVEKDSLNKISFSSSRYKIFNIEPMHLEFDLSILF